jgi:hypothetical protein
MGALFTLPLLLILFSLCAVNRSRLDVFKRLNFSFRIELAAQRKAEGSVLNLKRRTRPCSEPERQARSQRAAACPSAAECSRPRPWSKNVLTKPVAIWKFWHFDFVISFVTASVGTVSRLSRKAVSNQCCCAKNVRFCHVTRSRMSKTDN